MDSTAVTRERRHFARGVVGLIVLGVAVFAPIAYFHPGWASFLFTVQMLLNVAWRLRHQRVVKAMEAGANPAGEPR